MYTPPTGYAGVGSSVDLLNIRRRKWFPSWFGPAAGIAASAAGATYLAHKVQKSATSRDNLREFVTWKMKRSAPAFARPSGKRRTMYKRRYTARVNPKVRGTGYYRTLMRSTAPLTTSLGAAVIGAYASNNVRLDQIKTSDLLAAYRLFRIRKVVLHLVPRTDPSNQWIGANANNFLTEVAAACDPEAVAVPSSLTDVTAYANSYQKWLKVGDEFRYTFYPKVVGAVGSSGATSLVGSYGMNPWLYLDATGVSTPHQSLKLAFNVGTAPGAPGLSYDYFYDIYFDVKGDS